MFIRAPGSNTGLIRLDRVVQDTVIYISVQEEFTWPFKLVNDSSIDLKYSQTSWDEHIEPTSYILLPKESSPFCWEAPSAKTRRLMVEAANKNIPIDICDIGQLQPVMLKLPGGVKRSLSIDVVADGPVLQVVFRDFDQSRSLFQYRRRSGPPTSSTSIPDASSTTEDPFEIRSVQVVLNSLLCLRFPSIGITLINRYLEEVLYVSAKDLELRYTTSNLHITYGLTIGWLQLDNQLFDDWDHPILLYPAVISKKAQFKRGDEQPPFLSVALIQSVDSAHGVKYYKYFGFLMQEVVIDLGEHLMNKLMDMFSFESQDSRPNTFSPVEPADYSIQDMVAIDTQSDILYFELFQIHPIKINFTFSKLEGQVFDETTAQSEESYNPFETLANMFTAVMGSVSNAPLKFNTLILEHPIVRQGVLLTLIKQHYKDQAISQVHRIIGSADFLGNPVGLFSSFGSGVSDFFYEPLLGLVSDRPGDIGIGLAKGSLSLVRKTVVGVTDTFAKFTGSISKVQQKLSLFYLYRLRVQQC